MLIRLGHVYLLGTLLRRTFRGPKRRLETTSLSELSKEFQVYGKFVITNFHLTLYQCAKAFLPIIQYPKLLIEICLILIPPVIPII